MNLYRKFFALGAVVVLGTAFATADTVQLGSFATGASAGSNNNTAMNFAGFSLLDVVSSGTNNTFALNPGLVWTPNLAGTTWVGIAPNAGPGGGFNPPLGYYTFTTTFTATPGTYNGTASLSADDTTEVFLNGNPATAALGVQGTLGSDLQCAVGLPNCTMVDNVTLSGVNLLAFNTLTFIVQQAGNPNALPGFNPSGIDFTATLTSNVPEPSTLVLLGTGLISSAGMLLRRRRA